MPSNVLRRLLTLIRQSSCLHRWKYGLFSRTCPKCGLYESWPGETSTKDTTP
jgi:hypothetical protein